MAGQKESNIEIPVGAVAEAREKAKMEGNLTFQQMLVLVREANRDPEQEQKRKDEAKRAEARRLTRIRLIRAETANRAKIQAMCRHQKPRGEECSAGQSFSDGIYRDICLRCQKILRSYQTPELQSATDLVKRKFMEKAKELGISEEQIDDVFEDFNLSAID